MKQIRGLLLLFLATLSTTAGCNTLETRHVQGAHPHCHAPGRVRQDGGAIVVNGLVASPGVQIVPRQGLTLADALAVASNVTPPTVQPPVSIKLKKDAKPKPPVTLGRNDLFVCVTRDGVRHCIALYVVDTEPLAQAMLLRNGDQVEVLLLEAPELGTYLLRDGKELKTDRPNILKRLAKDSPGRPKAHIDARLFLRGTPVALNPISTEFDLTDEVPKFPKVAPILRHAFQPTGTLVQIKRIVDSLDHVYIIPRDTTSLGPEGAVLNDFLNAAPALDWDVYEISLPTEVPIFLDEASSRATREAVACCLRLFRKQRQER